jgi:hypothetical protein
MDPLMARKTWRTLEPFHGMIYFVPEAPAAYAEVGITDTRAGYFASRSAPMGAVGADVVVATFFNFSPSLVAGAVPGCWEVTTPSQLLAARLDAAGAALRRLVGDAAGGAEMEEAAELARTAATAPRMSPSGRPLYAGHASLAWPSDPLLALWHAISVLREYRGDGHIAALTTEGVDGCEALVTHAASGDFPKEVLLATRAWTEQEWAAAVGRLQERGWLEGEAFTDAGRAHRQRVEDRTDALALAPWQHLGEEGCDRLRQLVRPWSRAIVESGALGAARPESPR